MKTTAEKRYEAFPQEAQRPQSTQGKRVLERIPFGMQRKIVSHMTTKSWKEIPHTAYVYEPDVTDFFLQYKRMNALHTHGSGHAAHPKKITFNTLMLRALTEGIKAAPRVNAHIRYDDRYVRGHIDVLENIDITMPWLLPNGEMMTVNMHDFGSKTLDEMTAYMARISEKIKQTDYNEAMYEVSLANTMEVLKQGRIGEPLRKLIGARFGDSKANTLRGKAKKAYHAIPESKRLTGHDLEPGTVTISNIGSLYREQRGYVALLEIIPPQVFAIAIGAVQEKPLVVGSGANKRVEPRSVLPICLAFDHRALDFGEVVPFIQRMDEIFAKPEVIHSW